MRRILSLAATNLLGVSLSGGFVRAAAFTHRLSTRRASAAFTHRPSTRRASAAAARSMSASANHSDPFSLRGKTVLVTGASGGLGKGIAKRFAIHGADVIVHYNSRKEGAVSTFTEINDNYAKHSEPNGSGTMPGKCLGIIKADFRDPMQVQDMFRSVTDDILKDNRLDVLINNAGVVTKLAVEDDDDKLSVWHETMAVNLHAPLQLMKLAHAHMKSNTTKRKGGVIINNTSIHGSRSVEYMTAYAASKAALDSLTRGLACEYAADWVRVNAIAPGVVPVERTAEAFSNPDVVDMWTPHLPVGRLGTIEDIAQATVVLATNEWMSGTVLTVDGGMMARANMPIRPRPPKPESTSEEATSVSSEVSFEVPT